jgi:hypothetical protein
MFGVDPNYGTLSLFPEGFLYNLQNSSIEVYKKKGSDTDKGKTMNVGNTFVRIGSRELLMENFQPNS